jgi:predicted phosphodiesterase
MSDLHTEITGQELPITDVPECDYIVMAGDFSRASLNTLRNLAGYLGNSTADIIYVAGNHEHYKSFRSVPEAIKTLESDSRNFKSLYFAENKTVTFSGIRFICATLWTDYNLYGDQNNHMNVAERSMNDFSLIQGEHFPYLRAIDCIDWYHKSYQFIKDELLKSFDGKTLVVTHHLPSEKSINPVYGKSSLNPAFASNAEELIALEPDLWINGHTHSSTDYYIGKTRILCNPRGYLFRNGEYENKQWDPKLVVEI